MPATKLTHGAYPVVLAIPLLILLMRGIHRHHRQVRRELEPESGQLPSPSRVHAVVLVPAVHEPTLRALAFARATRPDALTALTVEVDEAATHLLRSERERLGIDFPLEVSPYRRSPDRSCTASSSAVPDRAAWCTSPSRISSSATGGKGCCTTRAPCG